MLVKCWRTSPEKIGETDVAISVVTLIELAHGPARADTPERKAKRQEFIQELLTVLPNHPVTAAVALRAGLIDGGQQARGPTSPPAQGPSKNLMSEEKVRLHRVDVGVTWRFRTTTKRRDLRCEEH
jgi:hypothetical protein